jgi:hypothetical protein
VIRELYQQLKRVEFIRVKMSYIILRGHLCDVMFMKVHALSRGLSCCQPIFFVRVEVFVFLGGGL